MKNDKDEFPWFHRHIMQEGRGDVHKRYERHERRGGFLRIYILHSLLKGPKSGYDLIKEISDKTEEVWIPSKGTLYPALKKMEEEKLIKLLKTAERSKNIYEITDEGREFLKSAIEHRKSAEEKMQVFRKIFFEIFHENSGINTDKIHEIIFTLEKIPPEKKAEALNLTDEYLEKLRGILDI